MLRLTLALFVPGFAFAADCASMGALKLPDTTVTAAAMSADASYCQVLGYVTTPGLRGEPANQVKFEVDLPAKDWNGKLYFAGGSGFIGGRSNKQVLSRGYASAYTDTGHEAASAVDATWARDSLTKKVDFFDRGIHVGTVAAKAVTRAFYEKELAKSYFVGCSTGGKQAFVEAQRYPDDFDGIVAGAPAVDYTGLMLHFNWNERVLLESSASYIPASKLPAIAKAVAEQCDAQDGLRDGLISQPQKCRFDPAKLQCDGADCLTAAQVDTLKKLYAGPGSKVFPGMPIGHEDSANYAAYIFGNVQPEQLTNGLLTFPGDYIKSAAAAPYDFAFQQEFLRYLAFEKSDPAYDWRSLRLDKDLAKIAVLGKLHNAVDPDMSRFQKHGGKLIIYNGWADPVVPPMRIVSYYEKVENVMGAEKTRSFARLFLAPGMNHCGGGPGPNSADYLGALERWSEQGSAPDQLIASHSTNRVVDRTRPLCPYPQVAKWKGSGSIDEAASFVCAAP